MSKYAKYIWYVIRHKWYVFLECATAGLWWRGIVHDLSKFRWSELKPYANHFYGPKKDVGRDETGYYKPTDTGNPSFDFAWFLHQKRNDHHWQYWVLPEEAEGVKVLPMSDKARREMIADWCGASKAQGHGGLEGDNGVKAWYQKHGHKMQLHPETRAWVEDFLGVKHEAQEQEGPQGDSKPR